MRSTLLIRNTTKCSCRGLVPSTRKLHMILSSKSVNCISMGLRLIARFCAGWKSLSELPGNSARAASKPTSVWMAAHWIFASHLADSASATKILDRKLKRGKSWAIFSNFSERKSHIQQEGNRVRWKRPFSERPRFWPRRPMPWALFFSFRSLNFFQPAEKSQSNGVPIAINLNDIGMVYRHQRSNVSAIIDKPRQNL